MNVAVITKKVVAAAATALGLAGFAMFAGISLAAAGPIVDTGTYDEQTDLPMEGCWVA